MEISVSREDFETKYISRASYDALAAEVERLTSALKAISIGMLYPKEFASATLEDAERRHNETLAAHVEQARAELARVTEANRWVAVGERLPDYAKRVMLFTATKETFTGWLDWTTKSGELYFVVYETTGKIHHVTNVTHWRPLPAPPE